MRGGDCSKCFFVVIALEEGRIQCVPNCLGDRDSELAGCAMLVKKLCGEYTVFSNAGRVVVDNHGYQREVGKLGVPLFGNPFFRDAL